MREHFLHPGRKAQPDDMYHNHKELGSSTLPSSLSTM
jgi:hypothetical protein